MLKKCRLAALIFRLSALLVGAAGLCLTLPGKGALIYTYFTVQTNIFTDILFAVLAAKTAAALIKDGPRGDVPTVNGFVQLGVTFFITITFGVYWLLLDSAGFVMTGMTRARLGNYIIHGAVPVLAILDWILFMPHGRLGLRAAFLWLAYPALYCAGALALGGAGLTQYGASRYPYFFIDADALGAGRLALYILLLAAAFCVLGLAFVGIDKALGKLGSRQ